MDITVSVNSEICFPGNRVRQTQKIVLNVVNGYMAQRNNGDEQEAQIVNGYYWTWEF